MIEELERARDEAERILAALKQEQNLLPGKFQAAAQTGDGALLLALRERGDELPSYLFAAEIAFLRCDLAVLDAEIAAVKPEHQNTRLDVQLAVAKVQIAQQELLLIQREMGMKENELRGLLNRQRTVQLKIDAMIDQQSSALAPVVRSKVHA